jgi:hypothetical protein
MTQFASEPTVWVHESQVTINVRLVDSTDNAAAAAWRGLFNDLAKESTVNAEAMGSGGTTVILLRLDRGTPQPDVVKALDEVSEIGRKADAGLWDRQHTEDQISRGAAEWWRRTQDPMAR